MEIYIMMDITIQDFKGRNFAKKRCRQPVNNGVV